MSVSVIEFVNKRSSCLESLDRRIQLAERWLKIEMEEIEGKELSPADLIKEKYKLQEECSNFANQQMEVDSIKEKYRGLEDFQVHIDKMVNKEIRRMQDYCNTSDFLDDVFMTEFENDQTLAGEIAKSELRMERGIAKLMAPYTPDEEQGNLVTLIGVTCIAILVAIAIWS
jgi:hypothetical protein